MDEVDEMDEMDDQAGLTPEPRRVEAASGGFLPSQPSRMTGESILVRLIATAGVVGIGTAVGAILGASHVQPWIMALAVSALSVVLAAVLWRSRRL